MLCFIAWAISLKLAMYNHARLEQELTNVSRQLTTILDDLLPNPAGHREDPLFEAMRYATLSNGKRIRPFLTVHTAMLFGVNRECALRSAAAIEMIHSYSLVHDDLPAIDNDDLRRGVPSCHKKFGEATAILAGDALLTYAFEILAAPETHQDPTVRIELIRATSQAAGHHGMVGGQMMDLLSEKQELSDAEIVRLQRMKTGELFATSCESGAILGKANPNLRAALRAYAHNIGLAFQITDDILDISGTRSITGKEVGKDQQAGKATLVSLWGVDKCRHHAETLANQAITHLSNFDGRADILRDVALFLVTRDR